MAKLTVRGVSRLIVATDIVAILVGVVISERLRFGATIDSIGFDFTDFFDVQPSPASQAALLFLIWVLALLSVNASDTRVLGVGIEEYKRLAKSGLYVPLIFAFGSLVVKLDVSRAFVATSVILGVALLFLHHWLWRNWLSRQRAKGNLRFQVAVIANNARLERLAKTFTKTTEGYSIGLFVVDDIKKVPASLKTLGIPIIENDEHLIANLVKSKIQLTYVSGTLKVTDAFIKRFSWQLEGTGIDLAVGTDLIDISLGRLDTIELGGVPTFLVRLAEFGGWKYFLKHSADFVMALIATVVTFPLVLIFGFAVWCEDRGPVIFTQERVGLRGNTFKIFKIRSMKVGAELEHDKLAAKNLSPNSVMYKNESDPRITRVGRFIRRWSIDELPQFWNVVLGNMSIVGPRPPLPSEITAYEQKEHRRHLVRPGITGLWQVSGRNSATWEETVRLDLLYVENWSLLVDFLIVLKTARSVLRIQKL